MIPLSSEVIEIIEEPQNMEPVLPSYDVELQQNALYDDVFGTVNGKYSIRECFIETCVSERNQTAG